MKKLLFSLSLATFALPTMLSAQSQSGTVEGIVAEYRVWTSSSPALSINITPNVEYLSTPSTAALHTAEFNASVMVTPPTSISLYNATANHTVSATAICWHSSVSDIATAVGGATCSAISRPMPAVTSEFHTWVGVSIPATATRTMVGATYTGSYTMVLSAGS